MVALITFPERSASFARMPLLQSQKKGDRSHIEECPSHPDYLVCSLVLAGLVHTSLSGRASGFACASIPNR